MLKQGRIQNLRKKLGWKQKDMAEALGIENPQTISHWEIGFRVPSGTAERLLLLLEKLRGKELRRVAKCLEKIGQEQTRSENNTKEKIVETKNVKRQKEIAQASFSANPSSNETGISNGGGGR